MVVLKVKIQKKMFKNELLFESNNYNKGKKPLLQLSYHQIFSNSSICNHTTQPSLIVYAFNCLTNYIYYKHNKNSIKTITVSRNNGWPSSKKMLLVLLYRSKSHFSPLSWRPLVIQSTMTKFESEDTLKTCF